jgi:hypothetical protein
MGDALDAAIDEVIGTLSDEQRAEPRFFPDNYPAWNEFLRRRYECELASYDGPPSSRAQQRRRLAPLVERARPHPQKRARAHRGWQLPRPRDAAAGGAFRVAPTWELVDATADGIPLVRVGVEVSIPLIRVGIDAEDDGEEGAGIDTATRGRSSGALIIREGVRASSLPVHGRKRKPRKEDAAAARGS